MVAELIKPPLIPDFLQFRSVDFKPITSEVPVGIQNNVILDDFAE